MRALTAVLCLGSLGMFHLSAQTAVLEDFSSARIPWLPYEGPPQTGGIENGMYKLKSNGMSGDGYGLYFQFLPYPYLAPNGFAQSWIKSGTADPNANRLSFKIKCDRRLDGGEMNFGTYVKTRKNTDGSWQGQHFYHGSYGTHYPNRWMIMSFNRVPQHRVGNSPTANYPEDPEWVQPTTGSPVHYFEGLTRFYLSWWSAGSIGATCWFDDFQFATVPGEPETFVSGTTVTHDGTAYEVSWNGPKNQSITYDVRYSTQSLKTIGFTNGTDGGTAETPGNDYTGVVWRSPNMAEASVLYIGVRPRGQTAFTELKIPALNSAGTNPTSKCDVNGDGQTNDTDVSLSIDSTLGKRACTADVDNNGACDVVDVQRVVNARSGACRGN